jgi:hypothetical protein
LEPFIGRLLFAHAKFWHIAGLETQNSWCTLSRFGGYEKVMAGMPTVVAVEVVFNGSQVAAS